MKNTLKQIFHDKKFIMGFIIFIAILATIIIYPLVVAYSPLEMVGGLFYKPGTYVSVSDTVESKNYSFKMDTSAVKLESALSMEDRSQMGTWLENYAGVDIKDIDVTDAKGLIKLWEKYYDPNNKQDGLIAAKKKYYVRLNTKIDGILEDTEIVIANEDEATGELVVNSTITSDLFVNINDIPNQRTFYLGTDNFGRDVLTELVYATKTSLKIGLIDEVIVKNKK